MSMKQEKVLEEQLQPKVVGVVVTRYIVILIALFAFEYLQAASLPEDRADIGYHYYDGGGVEVDGPSVIVRKSFANKYSVYGQYYQDTIVGASPDVLAAASRYTETRDEYSIGANYLHENTIMNAYYTYSDEDDYEGNSTGFDISHDMFGDLTTVALGFSYGWDTITRVDAPDFEEKSDRYQYRASISQVVTPTITTSFAYEAVISQGFLNNPYRFIIINGVPQGLGSEIYPGTRTSQAFGIRSTKYWKFRGATSLGYRYFTDTWDIKAHTIDFVYSQYIGSRWLTDLYLRYYTQDGASFYSNDFSAPQNFMARDKELSTYDSYSIGAKVSYQLFDQFSAFSNGTISFAAEYIDYSYDDYSGITNFADINDDPYSFDAVAAQVFFTVRY
ncbi:MAG: DUF3570 domain-containing protein [Pseudomonadota bacterium]